jgi:conjugal transfer/entry exclusion protein
MQLQEQLTEYNNQLQNIHCVQDYRDIEKIKEKILVIIESNYEDEKIKDYLKYRLSNNLEINSKLWI